MLQRLPLFAMILKLSQVQLDLDSVPTELISGPSPLFKNELAESHYKGLLCKVDGLWGNLVQLSWKSKKAACCFSFFGWSRELCSCPYYYKLFWLQWLLATWVFIMTPPPLSSIIMSASQIVVNAVVHEHTKKMKLAVISSDIIGNELLSSFYLVFQADCWFLH